MHANAAGFSIQDSKLAEFHNYANNALKDIDFSEGVYEVNFDRIAADKDIEALILDIGAHPEAWGQECNEPLISVQDINITSSDIQVMGKLNDTLKITKNGIAYMKFKATDMIEELKKYGEIKLNIVGKANINEWMGRCTPQIFIEDYEILDNTWGF